MAPLNWVIVVVRSLMVAVSDPRWYRMNAPRPPMANSINSVSCVSLDEVNDRLSEVLYTYKLYVDFDIWCELDEKYAGNDESEMMINEFYDRKYQLLNMMRHQDLTTSLEPYVECVNILRAMKIAGTLFLLSYDTSDEDDEPRWFETMDQPDV